MENNINKMMDQNWKAVRNRACIRALLIFLGIILMQLLAYIFCIIGVTVWLTVTGKNLLLLTEISTRGDFLILVSLVSALLSMVWCGILYNKSSWREGDFDYKKAFCMGNTLSAVGIGVGGCLALTMVLSFVSMAIPQAFSSYNAIMEQLTNGGAVLTVVYVLFVGPVSEELIFRGALFDRFYLAFPFLAANALQALLFGIYHMNLIQGLYAFCLGFVLGMIRYATGSILMSVLTHILFNSTSYMLDLIFPEGQEMSILQMVVLLFAGTVLCTFGMVRLLAVYRQKEVTIHSQSGR